jgi:hypothetical protein
MLRANKIKMILRNSWPVKIIYVSCLVLINLLSFIFEMIPNFELMADAFVNFEVALLTIIADTCMRLIDIT